MSICLGGLFLVSLFTGYALFGLVGLGLVQPATAIITKRQNASPATQV